MNRPSIWDISLRKLVQKFEPNEGAMRRREIVCCYEVQMLRCNF
jgi:hypothetical protein